MEVLNHNINSHQQRNCSFLFLSQENFRKPTTQYPQPDPFEREEDLVAKTKLVRIEDFSSARRCLGTVKYLVI